jgi:hypothetical protein
VAPTTVSMDTGRHDGHRNNSAPMAA